jgi:hypothetical protein
MSIAQRQLTAKPLTSVRTSLIYYLAPLYSINGLLNKDIISVLLLILLSLYFLANRGYLLRFLKGKKVKFLIGFPNLNNLLNLGGSIEFC